MDNRREEIQHQIEFYFSEDTMIREDLLRNICEADCGYVTICLLMMLPKLQALNCNAVDVQTAVQNSAYLLLSNDGKRIRRVAAYRLPDEPSDSFFHGYSTPSTFIHAVQLRRFISAKKLFKRRDATEVALLRLMGRGELQQLLGRRNFKSFFISPSIHSPLIRFSQRLDVLPVQSFVFLLLTVFPRLLLAYPDIIREPSIFQRPNWENNWELAMQSVEQGLTKIDSSAIEVIPGRDYSSPDGDLCIIKGVDAVGALLLASILCVNPRIVAVHDIFGSVRIKVVSISCHGSYRSDAQITTYRMKSVSSSSTSSSNSGEREVGVVSSSCRIATPDEVRFLQRLRLEVIPLPPLCHINWEFYSRELLESMVKVAATNTVEVSEMMNVDYNLPEGELLRVDGVNAEEARVIASAICNSRIIVVHDKGSTIWIKDITMSGPLRFDGRRTSYRVLPPEGLASVPAVTTKTISVGSREMTEAELRYLRDLRWRVRLPALVVAARFRGGWFFHVLKMVATFL